MSIGYQVSDRHKKITVTLQKIATNTFLDTGCLMSNIYFFFLNRSHYIQWEGK